MARRSIVNDWLEGALVGCSAVDIYLAEVGDVEEDFPALDEWDGVWRVTVVAMPTGKVLARDVFPERPLALARAHDFERLLLKSSVQVRRHFTVRPRTPS